MFADKRRFFEIEVVKRNYAIETNVTAQASDRHEQLFEIPFALVARHKDDFIQAFPWPSSVRQNARRKQVNLTAKLFGFDQKAMSLFIARQTQYSRRHCAAVRGDVSHQSLNNNNFLRLTTVIFFRETV